MYYEHPVKCLECSLHFIALSHRSDWEFSGGCPECDGKTIIQWTPRIVEDQEIYMAVPGYSLPKLMVGDV